MTSSDGCRIEAEFIARGMLVEPKEKRDQGRGGEDAVGADDQSRLTESLRSV
jgi:hypothetical protein